MRRMERRRAEREGEAPRTLQETDFLLLVDDEARQGALRFAECEGLVLNILISNTDDHLRNHGFLYEGPDGWRLSPAYDLNPVPTDIKPRILSTAINEDDSTASMASAMEVAGYFQLDAGKARDIATQVGIAVSKWRAEAARHGLNKAEIDRMASAFEHEDLQLAGGKR
jgi:serine/threonine-protein kinase HipA